MQRCKNVRTCKQCLCKKNPISGKIFAKFYAVLFKKVSNVPILRFLVAFYAHFETFCYFLAFFCTYQVFGAFYAVFSQIRFVIIFAPFGVKLLWLKPCLFRKFVFLHLWWYLKDNGRSNINCVEKLISKK